MKVSDTHTWDYCPYCGAVLEHKTIKVAKYKTNLITKCEEHGELYL